MATEIGSFAGIGSAWPFKEAELSTGTDTRLGTPPSKPAAITVTLT